MTQVSKAEPTKLRNITPFHVRITSASSGAFEQTS